MPAEGQGKRGLLSNRVVAGDSLRNGARFGGAEEDMGGCIVFVVIGSQVGIGRFREWVILGGRPEDGEFGVGLCGGDGGVGWGVGRVPALGVGVEVHDCYYY